MYDAIIMDPPSYGHGPHGEAWQFHKQFPELLAICMQLFSKQPLFILVNAYAISSSALMLVNSLTEATSHLGGRVSGGELVLEEKARKWPLSTGLYAKWEATIA